MFSKLLVIAVFVSVVYAQRQLPVRSSSGQDNQQSEYFRESVAQSIRDNIARQRSNVNSQFQTIDYPGTVNTLIEHPAVLRTNTHNLFQTIEHPGNVITNNEHQATFPVSQPQPESVIRQIPSVVTPIVHIPLPVIRSQPPQRHPERITFPTETVDNRITIDDVPLKKVLKQDADDQAKNAHYSFDSSVQDTINDHSHTRQETRDGLALKGMYSYSDGFFRRTVHYAADEGGYRVTKEEIVPIGDGPQFNPDGKADVSTSLSGRYTITTDDLKRAVPNKVQSQV